MRYWAYRCMSAPIKVHITNLSDLVLQESEAAEEERSALKDRERSMKDQQGSIKKLQSIEYDQEGHHRYLLDIKI